MNASEFANYSPENQNPTSQDERHFASWMHLAIYSTIVFNLFGLFVPLVMWIMKKDKSPFIDRHGKAILNFVSTILAGFVLFGSVILAAVIIFNVNLFQSLTSGSAFELPWISLSLPFALAIMGSLFSLVLAVLPIFGFIAAGEGRVYRYPLAIRFFR